MPFRCLLIFLASSLLGLPYLLSQDDDAAKASIIQGIKAFRSGETYADSLFALGESHSELNYSQRTTVVAAF